MEIFWWKVVAGAWGGEVSKIEDSARSTKTSRNRWVYQNANSNGLCVIGYW